MSEMRRHPDPWGTYPRSPEEALLAQHISEVLIEVRMTQEQRHQIGPSLTPGIIEMLDLCLTIAQNALAESRRFLGAGKLAQSRGRLELAENELKLSRGIIHLHKGNGDCATHQ